MASKPAGKGRRGLRLGNYDLSSPAQTWDQGTIYRALDASRREVAVKLLAGAAEDPASLKKLQQEVSQASRCRQSNILRVFELAEANGTWFLVTELVDGVFLPKHIADKGPVTAAKAERWLGQMAKALEHAHQQGMVPETTPSAFLVSQGNIKLVPMPSLLKSGEKAETGFVAPELKRNAQGRDVRSALFGLGATLHYMLTGKPPAAPLELDAEISDHLLSILERLLADKPDDRYQEPAELLADLDVSADEPEEEASDETIPEEEEGDAAAPAEDAITARPKNASWLEQPRDESPANKKQGEKNKKAEVTDDDLDGEEGKPKQQSPERKLPPPYVLGGAAAAVVAVVGIGIFLATRDGEPDKPPPNPQTKNPPVKVDPNPKPEQQPVLDVAALQQEFEGPWAKASLDPKDVPVLRVSRLPAADGAKVGKSFTSLGAACAAAAEKTTTVIEIHDNGPLFEVPISVSDRNLIIRAGAGFWPLLFWDLSRWKAKDAAALTPFLSMEGGDLMLGGVEMAVDWPADSPAPTSLIRVSNGDFLGWNSTFSATGTAGLPVSVVRVEGDQPGKRCRLRNCFARGPNLIAVDLKAVAPEVMLDQCLIAGKELPLIRSQSTLAQDKLPTVRVIRSTMTSERGIVQARAADPKTSGLRMMFWDAILARAAKDVGGTLFELPKDAETANYQWKAINSLYAGFGALLDGPEKLDDFEAWKKRWNSPGPESIYPKPWIELSKLNPAQSYPAQYVPDPALAFEATFGTGVIGCDLSVLLWSRSAWPQLGYTGFKTPALDLLKDSKPPKIPEGKDGKYYGGKVDLTKTDIVAHLEEMQRKQELGQVIVLHLSGSGVKKISPLRMKNRSLVLYFEPPAKGKEPLVLAPETSDGPIGNALFQLESGSLELIGGDIRVPDAKTAKVPHYLIHVLGGNLHLHGTRLQGPLGQSPDSFWGLIRLEGSGFGDRQSVRGCAIHECVLQSPRVGVHVAGIGARLRLEQNLIVTTGDALHFQPGANPPPNMNVQCSLANNTIAARQSVIHMQDLPTWPAVADPIVFETTANVFMNPFLDRDQKGPSKSTMLLYQGLALPRGVLAWQGRGDVYDNRITAYALVATNDGLPPRKFAPQTYATWENLWGRFGARDAILNVPFKNTIDLDQPRLDQLAYPEANPAVPLGANLQRLGIKK